MEGIAVLLPQLWLLLHEDTTPDELTSGFLEALQSREEEICNTTSSSLYQHSYFVLSSGRARNVFGHEMADMVCTELLRQRDKVTAFRHQLAS